MIGSAVHDARIAAVCLEHGVRLIYSLYRDFSRFAGLNVQNPLM
jgi:predicted nucleic acid-binding protein